MEPAVAVRRRSRGAWTAAARRAQSCGRAGETERGAPGALRCRQGCAQVRLPSFPKINYAFTYHPLPLSPPPLVCFFTLLSSLPVATTVPVSYSKETELKTTLVELLIYITFLVTLSLSKSAAVPCGFCSLSRTAALTSCRPSFPVTFGMVSTNMYYLNKVMEDLFVEQPYSESDGINFRNIRNHADFWKVRLSGRLLSQVKKLLAQIWSMACSWSSPETPAGLLRLRKDEHYLKMHW